MCIKLCKVKHCNHKHYAKGYCAKHWKQINRYGKILNRTRFDLNEIINYKKHAEIVIYNKHKKGCEPKEKCRSIIDLKNVDKVKSFKWSLTALGYVKCVNQRIWLHRLITTCPGGKYVDHINHNLLDNRNINLRIVTIQQNNQNNSVSKGYSWDKSKKSFEVYININGRKKYIALTKTEKEAIILRKKAEIKYFKEYRYKKIE